MGVQGPGCALGCRSPEVLATRRCGAAASGETEDGDVLRLALHPLCSDSDPPDLGSRSPGLKLCLRLRPGPLLPGSGTQLGLPGPQLPTPGLGTLGTRGPRAEHRALQLRGARGTPHRRSPDRLRPAPRTVAARTHRVSGLARRSPSHGMWTLRSVASGPGLFFFFPRFLTALRRLTPDPRLRLVRLRAGRGGAGMLTDSRASWVMCPVANTRSWHCLCYPPPPPSRGSLCLMTVYLRRYTLARGLDPLGDTNTDDLRTSAFPWSVPQLTLCLRTNHNAGPAVAELLGPEKHCLQS